MSTKTSLLIVMTALALSSCTAQSYCRRMQRESPLPIALDACEKCYRRYGEMDRDILIGCAIGTDIAGAFTE